MSYCLVLILPGKGRIGATRKLAYGEKQAKELQKIFTIEAMLVGHIFFYEGR